MTNVNADRARTHLTDHPNQTAGQVATALGISVGAAVAALNKLIRSWEVVGQVPDNAGRVVYRLENRKEGDLS